MVDLQRVQARVAQAQAEHELAQKLAEIKRTATVAELDAAIDALKAVMATYEISYFDIKVAIPAYSGAWSHVKPVTFTTHYTGEQIVTQANQQESVEDFMKLFKMVTPFVQNLTEDQVVELWLGKYICAEGITLRGKRAYKLTHKASQC